MADRRRWSDLSQRTRRLLIVAGVAEGCIKTAALIDISAGAATEIRGSKWIWAVVIVVVNSLGAVHLVLLRLRRRRQPDPPPDSAAGTG